MRVCLIFVRFAILQTFRYGLNQNVQNQGDGSARVVIRWDGKIHRTWVRIGINHGEHRDAKFACLSKRNVFFHYVDDENRRRDAVQIRDGTEVLFQFCTLTADLQALTLGHGVQRTVLLHFVDLRHLAHRLSDRGEVCQHTSRPTLCDIRHTYCLYTLCYDFFGLLLRCNEQDFLSALGDLLHCCRCLVKLNACFVQVNNVNAFLLREDVRRHVRVPLALEVAEVNSGLEHLLEGCVFHVYFPGLSNSLVAAECASPKNLDAKQIIMFW